MMERIIKGSNFTIIHCDGALESMEQALSGCKATKRRSLERGIQMQIERLANGHRLSKEHFPPEGQLPNNKKFYAFKRKPLRAYCWLSTTRKNTYFVSHYVHKKCQKLSTADTNKISQNWRRIEEGNDEF